jgi:ferric-dicitrate binding protein FerR (iron transport regulator)
MALSIPELTDDLLSKLKSGDVGALETLFRAAYPALLAKAKEVVDDDAAAARVVERLIPKVFAERATLTTPDAFAASLESALHEAAVRERSRLAGLHKHDTAAKKASAPAPTVDSVWSHIATAIQGPSAEARAEAQHMRAKAAHDAAGHIKAVTRGAPWYLRIGGAAVAIVIVLGIYWYITNTGERGRLVRQLSIAVEDKTTGTGQRGTVTLDDGTRAALGADTRVAIPEGFSTLTRVVGLSGVAEFTPPDAELPFQVLTGDVLLTAAGAESFAVRNHRDDSSVTIRVKQGSVKVEVEEPEEIEQTLTAGQSLVIAADGSTSQATEAQLAESFGYLEGNLTIGNRPLKAALNEIRRWYGTELFLQDTTLGSRPVSFTAPLTSSSDVIKAIESASGLTFGWEGRRMMLTAKPPEKAK